MITIPRGSSTDEKIIWLILGLLILIGFIIKIAQALALPALFFAIVFLVLWYFSKDDNSLKASAICLFIFFVFVVIGFIFGNSEIGKQSQEIYSLAVNVSKLKYTP